MSSRRHRMLQRAPPGRGTENRRARALHLVFEILGRHPLEDLRPFVARDTGEVLIGSLLFALGFMELAGGLEHFLGNVDRRLGPQRRRARGAWPRIAVQLIALAGRTLASRDA